MKNLKNYLPLLLSISIVFLLFTGVTKGWIMSLKDNYPLLSQGYEKLSVLKQKGELLVNLDALDLAEKIKKLNFVLPSEKSIDGLILTIDRLSSQASVSVTSVGFTPGIMSEKNITDNNGINITLIIEGKFTAIKAFLEQLKDSLLAIKINSVKINSAAISQETGTTTANIALTVYYKTADMTLGVITKPIIKLTKEEEAILTQIKDINLPAVITPPVSVSGRENPFY